MGVQRDARCRDLAVLAAAEGCRGARAPTHSYARTSEGYRESLGPLVPLVRPPTRPSRGRKVPVVVYAHRNCCSWHRLSPGRGNSLMTAADTRSGSVDALRHLRDDDSCRE